MARTLVQWSEAILAWHEPDEMLSFARPHDDDSSPWDDVSCGMPLDGVKIHIGHIDNPLEDGHVGEILVRSRSLCVPMSLDEDADSPFERGWLHTGDVGYVRCRNLYIRGRSKDLIVANGQNILPEDVEMIVSESPYVRAERVVAFAVGDRSGEGAVVLAETKKRPDDVRSFETSIRRAVLEELGVRVSDLVIVPKDAIERTTSGKVRRQIMRSRYLKGDL